jgi:hypothetical protein
MNQISLVFLLFLLIACSKEEYTIEEPSEEEHTIEEPSEEEVDAIIEVTGEVNRAFLGRSSVLLKLSIIDGFLPRRDVTVRITPSDIAPKGALILTTSGFGGSFYGGDSQKDMTIDFALSNGLQVLEITWEGEYGWATNAEGMGYTRALRAYSKIVKWLKENRIVDSSLIICHGGSGGAMQIAYGLANFNLEEMIDYAILTGGPPTSDLKRAVYGDLGDEARWPNGLLALGKTDYIMGWEGNGNYCKNRGGSSLDFVIETLEAESLVNNSSTKDYHYETTKLYFVNTDDLTNADEQGFLYYDMITSDKNWTFLPQETSHGVGGIEAGATRIREILNEITQ